MIFFQIQRSFNLFTVSVDSCTKSKLVLSVTDAAGGGIIYIQGQGAACKQSTFTGTLTHEFDFASCGIQWVNIATSFLIRFHVF